MSHQARALAQGAKPWPTDAELVELMRQHRTYTKVAAACGKSREALRDYLRVRPALRARLSRLQTARRNPVPVARARMDLDARREQRRTRYVDRGDSREYERILRGDPCSYGCGRRVEVTDHIHPASRGGAHSWENYTGACFPCNSSKGTKPLLLWLLDRSAAGGELGPVLEEQDLERSSA